MTNERKKAWWIRDPDRDEKTDRKKPNDAERRKKYLKKDHTHTLTGEVNTEMSCHTGKEGRFSLWLRYKIK